MDDADFITNLLAPRSMVMSLELIKNVNVKSLDISLILEYILLLGSGFDDKTYVE